MKLLFFSHLKSVTGCSETTLPGSNLSEDELWDKLMEEYPRLAPFRRCVRFACNGEYVGHDARFHADDEVALIPPVSGG